MKHTLFLFILLSFCSLLISCNDKRDEIPEGVMDSTVFVDFLTEAHLIESYNYVVVVRSGDSLAYRVTAAYDSLYHKYGITAEDYDSTLMWYVSHPQLLERVYRRVTERLKQMSDEEMQLAPDAVDSVETPTPEVLRNKRLRILN